MQQNKQVDLSASPPSWMSIHHWKPPSMFERNDRKIEKIFQEKHNFSMKKDQID